MSKINYCLPIIKIKKADVLSEIKNNPSYDFYEIWLDYLIDMDEIFIEDLVSQYDGKLIMLLRRKKLETPKLSLQMRQKIMCLLANKKILLDLDISQVEELSFIKTKKLIIQLLCSYHNYRETPDDKMLAEIHTTMKKHNPVIYKIATFCNDDSDAVRLMKLLAKLKSQDQKHIILGMGKFGTMTRIAGALWGNAINFVPTTKEEASAPGQLTKQQLETIIKELVPKT
ncbi:MAG: type I 3-dehydroquinate dehydratase [Candidatus Levyibacteriota bacterium]